VDSGTYLKTGDILAPGGLKLDLGSITPAQSKQAFDKAAAEADNDEDRIMLAYKYLQQNIVGDTMGPIEDDVAEQVKPVAAKRGRPPGPKSQQSVSDVSDKLDYLITALARQTHDSTAKVEEPRVEVTPEPVAVVPANMMDKDEAFKLLRTGFDSLAIPDLGPSPVKPQHKLTFDLGEGGKLTSWYHWVNEQDDGLFLIYDTRFDYGTVFEPPNLGERRPIRVTHTATSRSWDVYSLGFVHSFGVFNIINLVIAKPASQDASFDYMTTEKLSYDGQ